MDLNKMLEKLTTGDRVIVVSAVLLFFFSFFPWYGKSSYSRNGWSYIFFGVLPILLGLAMLAVIVIQRFTTTKLPDLPLPWAQVLLIAGSVSAVLILLKLIIGDKYSYGATVFGQHVGGSVTLDRSFGLFLSFLAAAGLAAGGFLKTKDPAEEAGGEAAPPAPPAAT